MIPTAKEAKKLRRAEERALGLRRPLVYATPGASRQAAELLPGRCLENTVEDAILAGRARGTLILLGGGVAARAVRTRSPNGTGRKAWTVTSVHRRAGA